MERLRGPISAAWQRGGSDNDRPSRRARAFAGFAAGGSAAALWALPLAGGLLVAIPLCVLTADPRFGRWLRERQIAAIPEEHPVARPPAVAGLALQPQAEPD